MLLNYSIAYDWTEKELPFQSSNSLIFAGSAKLRSSDV